MERDCKRKKMKKRESCEERSPLQCLNGLPFYKRNTKKNSDTSSSAPNSSRFLLSDNPSSSSRTHLDKKPKTLSRLPKNEGNKSRSDSSNVERRYKENEMPRKPLLQRSRKGKPQFTAQGKNWPINAKPTCKKLERSKLSSVKGKSEDKLEKGFQGFQRKMKISEENGSSKYEFKLNRASNGSSNSNYVEDFTPMSGRLASGHGDSLYERDYANANGNSNSNSDSDSDVKTPPIEASQSPEIEFQTQPKMLVLKSVGTPVIYGAGHLVSGVSDKRKSRRRGSLRAGPEKAILFSDENVSDDMQESLVPLLAEASVRWYSSPSYVGHGSQILGFGDRLDGNRVECDDELGTLDLLSSPSMLREIESNLSCGERLNSSILRVGSLSDGDFVQTQDSYTLDLLCSPSMLREGESNLSCGKRLNSSILRVGSLSDGDFIQTRDSYTLDLLSSPSMLRGNVSNLSCGKSRDTTILKVDSLNDGDITQTQDSYTLDLLSSPSMLCGSQSNFLNVDSLDNKNIIKTLASNSSSEACTNSVWSELDPITETLSRVKLSPKRSEISMWDPTKLQENVDIVSSWVSDTTTDDLTLSRMRISWCEELEGKTVQSDEFDCCCLSDEEIDEETHKVNEEDGLSPVLIDCEPHRVSGKKGEALPVRPDSCAESISTDGGGLAASNDSDWSCFQEDTLFHAT